MTPSLREKIASTLGAANTCLEVRWYIITWTGNDADALSNVFGMKDDEFAKLFKARGQ
jgi:hypothetical protein